jgi:cytochrome c biogenesis protein ResB
MTAGTILESRESREVARSLVYGAAWFDMFLFLIAVNLVTAVINRIPIKRHQWSFVLTHFSIVLLLGGAWVSRTFGYEGRLAIREGSEESRIVLDSFEVRARWPAGADRNDLRAVEASFPLPWSTRQAGRTLQQEGAERPGIRVVDYVSDGVASAGLGE